MGTNNNRALWDLTRGQRSRFLAALVALAIGTLFLYVAPQIVRLAIDGVLAPEAERRHVPIWINRTVAVMRNSVPRHRRDAAR